MVEVSAWPVILFHPFQAYIAPYQRVGAPPPADARCSTGQNTRELNFMYRTDQHGNDDSYRYISTAGSLRRDKKIRWDYLKDAIFLKVCVLTRSRSSGETKNSVTARKNTDPSELFK